MTTQPLPVPAALQPVSDDKNLLAPVDEAGSCCGGGCCSTD